MRALLALTLCAAGLAGCDPYSRVHGRVLAACADPPRPVAGAQVHLVCDGHPIPLATSDADGRIVGGVGGSLAERCVVRVSHPDYHPEELRPSDHCALVSTFIDLDQCHALAIDARLVPRARAPSP